MKLTEQQIINMAPFAAYVRIDDTIFRVDYLVAGAPGDRNLYYSDPDPDGYGEQFVTSIEDLTKLDVVFYELKEMAVVG